MSSIRTAVLSIVAVVMAVLSGGCQTHRLPEEVSKKIDIIKNEVAMGRATLTNATAALKNLRDAKDAQIQPAFNSYTKSVQTLEEKAAGVGFVFDMSQDRAGKYFTKWDKSISELTDDDLRNRSAERKAVVLAAYDDYHKKVEALRASFIPFMGKLKDVQKVVANELGTGGKAVAVPTINDTLEQEKVVLRDIDAVTAALTKLQNP